MIVCSVRDIRPLPWRFRQYPTRPAIHNNVRRRAFFLSGFRGSSMSNQGIDGATVWPATRMAAAEDESGVWQNTIAAADYALEEANRIHRGVQSNLKLMQEVRALREELRKAHAEADRYRGMHARVVVSMRQLE